MTHDICTSDAGGELLYFQRLFRTLLAPNTDPHTKLEQYFVHETAKFGMDYGFFTYINLENKTQRFEVVHGSHDALNRNTPVPLSKTYCRKIIADPEGTLAVSDALGEGWRKDPAYETFGFESYLGTTVSVDDNLYGTLCFANTTPRDDPITDKEKALLETHSQLIECILTHWGEPPVSETGVDTIEDCAVSSDDLDLMMDALRNRRSRVILMTLLEHDSEISVDTVERRMDDENALLLLVHSDLPKLADIGYITWDSDSKTISTGPKFSEAEPLVQLLNEYSESFPE